MSTKPRGAGFTVSAAAGESCDIEPTGGSSFLLAGHLSGFQAAGAALTCAHAF